MIYEPKIPVIDVWRSSPGFHLTDGLGKTRTWIHEKKRISVVSSVRLRQNKYNKSYSPFFSLMITTSAGPMSSRTNIRPSDETCRFVLEAFQMNGAEEDNTEGSSRDHRHFWLPFL